ncbi:MAG: Aspartate carbamoyltransferase catalytic subunit [Firmicutes bacterium]|nr:Aspartate carbamoyltransferase catalytic subunit [candidate division NPL-UPA2 bacterium]MBT9154418.1 Aspartate carbamoyltransferase catalytic subunit [candidate division NPL-UPA2 bacterium]MBT9156614.1 Aspartate carbamoyltransferase catalytic subunit [candidate division NPL-UPA2 bacterium]
MQLKGRHLISPNDLTLDEIDGILRLAHDMRQNRRAYADSCRGSILGTLFYEPSTRTKLSFESAMLRLGGQVLGFADANTSAVAKGESIADTIRVLDGYADVVVMRHPKEGAPKLAARYARVPVINGGDGGHQHPTQTLTDLLTIDTYKGRLHGLRVAFCGDLKFGRTVHSLIETLARYPKAQFYLVSPEELVLPERLRQHLERSFRCEMIECRRLEEALPHVDVLYMTRIQRERFFNEADYQRLKNSYILDAEKMREAQPNMIVMHPLPRVNEIAYEVDKDDRAVYFPQAELGVYVRMSLISHLLGVNQ